VDSWLLLIQLSFLFLPECHWHTWLQLRGESWDLQADRSCDALWEHEIQAEAARGAGRARWHRRYHIWLRKGLIWLSTCVHVWTRPHEPNFAFISRASLPKVYTLNLSGLRLIVPAPGKSTHSVKDSIMANLHPFSSSKFAWFQGGLQWKTSVNWISTLSLCAYCYQLFKIPC
jgi:hypothetical protein